MVDVRPEVDDEPREQAPTLIPDPPTVASITNTFRYTSETPRIYMDRSLEVHFGDVVEWPNGAPDVLWVPTDSKE